MGKKLLTKKGLLEWINEELSYQKIDPEPEGWVRALEEVKERYFGEERKSYDKRFYVRKDKQEG